MPNSQFSGGIKIKFSVKDRILLHLLGYFKYKSQSEVPFAITQKGIAENIGIRLSHVPRGMKQLEDTGLVVEVSAHMLVPDGRELRQGALIRKRKTYFLTDKGITIANKLRTKLESKNILLKDTNCQPRSLKLSELNNILQKRERGTIVELYDFIITNGDGEVFNLGEWKEQLELQAQNQDLKNLSKMYPGILKRIPKYEDFFGREKELKKLKNLIDSDKYKLILIGGDKGIGKTALVSKNLTDYENTKNILWCNIGSPQIFQETLEGLSMLFALANRRGLRNYLSKHSVIDIDHSKILDIIQKEIQDLSTLIIIDGISKIDNKSRELYNLGRLFQSLINNLPELKVIITSRIIDSITNELNLKIGSKHIGTIGLKGLDKSSSKRILTHEGYQLDKYEFEGIYHHTGGNPAYLEIVRTIEIEPPEGHEKYTPNERALLRYMKAVERLGE